MDAAAPRCASQRILAASMQTVEMSIPPERAADSQGSPARAAWLARLPKVAATLQCLWDHSALTQEWSVQVSIGSNNFRKTRSKRPC